MSYCFLITYHSEVDGEEYQHAVEGENEEQARGRFIKLAELNGDNPVIKYVDKYLLYKFAIKCNLEYDLS